MTLLNVQLRRLLLLCDHRNKTDLRRDKDTFSRQMSCKFYCHQWKVWHILQHCLWHNTVCRFLLKICTLVDTKFFSSNLIWIYLKKDCNCDDWQTIQKYKIIYMYLKLSFFLCVKILSSFWHVVYDYQFLLQITSCVFDYQYVFQIIRFVLLPDVIGFRFR